MNFMRLPQDKGLSFYESKETAIERFGAGDITSDMSSLTPEQQEALGPYILVRSEWQEAIQQVAQNHEVASRSVQQLGDAMENGVILRPDNFHSTKGRVVHNDTERLRARYGYVKGSEDAIEAHQQLVKVAEKAAARCSKVTKDNLEAVIWKKAGEIRPTNLIDNFAELHGKVLVANAALKVMKQVGRLTVRGGLDELGSDRVGKSQLSVAESAEIKAPKRRDELQLVMSGVVSTTFEKYSLVRYGGREGLVGSSRSENLWVPVEPEIIEHDSLSIPILDYVQHSKGYPLLHSLGNEENDMWQNIDRLRYGRPSINSRRGEEAERNADGHVDILFEILDLENLPEMPETWHNSQIRVAYDTARKKFAEYAEKKRRSELREGLDVDQRMIEYFDLEVTGE